MKDHSNLLSYMAFVLLYVISIIGFFSGAMPSSFFGVIVAAWGLLALQRSLWLYETSVLLRDINEDTESKSLPWLILNRMQIRERIKSGYEAIQFLNEYLFFWLFLGAVFIGWCLFTGLLPHRIPEIAVLNYKISGYFGLVLDEPFSRFYSTFDVVKSLGVTLIIGCAFFLIQSYSFRRYYSDSVFLLSVPVFAFSFLMHFITQSYAAPTPETLENIWYGFGAGNIELFAATLEGYGDDAAIFLSSRAVRIAEVGLSGLIFLLVIIFYTFCIFVRAAIVHKKRVGFSILGVIVLVMMGLADIYFRQRPSLDAIWLSGWVLVAICWYKSMYKSTHRYWLYQG